MGHEIEIIDGKASFFAVGETPWHGLGTRLEAPPTTAEAIRLAGLDWEVLLKPLCVAETGQEVPARATVRQSDGKILGVVGPEYQPLQNREAFGFFDPFVTAGEATLETAGSLREGKRVFVLARIRRDPISIVDRADDTIARYASALGRSDPLALVRNGPHLKRDRAWALGGLPAGARLG
jgi:phage/plasmid-like protein (TIGR03299 family)